MKKRKAALTVRSPASGIFILPTAEDWPGRFVPQGEAVGYVLHAKDTTIRVAITQADIGLQRERLDSVTVSLAEHPGERFAARIVRELPGATRTLPSAALALPVVAVWL